MAARNRELPPTTPTENKRKQFSSINKMPKHYSQLDWGVGTYRWLVFNRHTNGFKKCLIKIGNRWVIDLDCFESWMDEHRGAG